MTQRITANLHPVERGRCTARQIMHHFGNSGKHTTTVLILRFFASKNFQKQKLGYKPSYIIFVSSL
jgi:hypothetical protein